MRSKSKKNQNVVLTPENVITRRRIIAESRDAVKQLLLKIVIVVVLVYVAFNMVWGFAIVTGSDMAPAMKDGDLTLLYKLDDNYVNTEVIKYEVDGIHYFGRIVALEGDTVEISDDSLIVNGNHVEEEEIFYPTTVDSSEGSRIYQVGEDEVYVLGDYRTRAKDSRQLGPIKKSQIEGKVIGYFRRRSI